MVSKFSNVFLTLALGIPLAQPGTHLARGEDIHPQPFSRSPASPEVATCNYPPNNPQWAGAQCSKSIPFNYLYSTFEAPYIWENTVFDGGVRVGVVLGNLTCSKVMLSAVQVTVENQVPTYRALYGTQLDEVNEFPTQGLIQAGDEIRVTVYASALIGFAMVEKLTFPDPWMTYWKIDLANDSATCNKVAQWIVEDYKTNGVYVPLAEFLDIVLYEAFAVPPWPGSDTCTPRKTTSGCEIEREDGPLTFSYNGEEGFHIDWKWAGRP